jgi:hypothetical protein
VDRKTANNPANAKEINEKGNLLRFILSGISLRLRGNVASNAIPKIRSMLLGLQLPTEKLLLYLILSFKSLNLRLRMSEDDMMKMVHDVIGVDTPLPDAVDLVDELGMMASQLGFIDNYDNIPFIRRLVDSLHDLAQCSFEAGLFTEDLNASVQIETQGVKELFDLVIGGLEEAND